MPTVIAGNWKMHKTLREARSLAESIVEQSARLPAGVDVLLFPPFTALAVVSNVCRDSRVATGGQNFHPAREGAFTGEISARMLLDAGATWVLVGHSERRTRFGETDAFLGEKVGAAVTAGLRPLFCLGEDLAQREAGRTEEILARQMAGGLGSFGASELETLVVAYEPVWAIGTGRTATPDQAEASHHFLREQCVERWGATGAAMPILYGGSVQPGNAGELLSRSEIGGLLVGGASLEAGSFLEIAGAGA